MAKPKFPYPGDISLKRLLERYRCPAPFHVVRMRMWGEIVSPSLEVSPVKTIEALWPDGLPAFDDAAEANAFFQSMMGLWNNLARFQSGSPPVRLQKIDKIDTREALHAAASLRLGELYDGFMQGFTGGKRKIDVPAGVADLLAGIEKGIELLAMTRNTFAAAPERDGAAMVAELGRAFPEVDRGLHSDLNGIAVAVTTWRMRGMGGLRGQASGRFDS
jgi:hypothetical protein